MKFSRTRLGLLVLFSILLGHPGPLKAQSTAFMYQGRLNDGDGVANGAYDFIFALFATDMAGDIIGGRVTNTSVSVTSGLFLVQLDFGTNVFGREERWLEVSVRKEGDADFTTLNPRQKIGPIAYAVQAGSAEGLTQGSILPIAQGGTGADSAVTALSNMDGASLSQSNVFAGANTMLNPANRFGGSFRGNGTFLIGVDAENLVGTLQSNQLKGTYSHVLTLNNGLNSFLGSFAGDGSGLTNLNLGSLETTGVVTIARGGTGASTADEARTNLGAAARGANDDITALNGLSTPLSVDQGGTGETTASAALTNLGGASLAESNFFWGANVMLNSANLFGGAFSGDGSGLTNLRAENFGSGVLSVGQGGTGASSASGARTNLGAAARGANDDISSLSGLMTPLSMAQGGTGATNHSKALSNLRGASLGESNFFSGANTMLDPANIFGGRFIGDGSELTNLTAGNFAGGVMPVAQGGTGAGTASEARTNLGAAGRGANGDITSLNALKTPLFVEQGGTGATNRSSALVNLGGASLTRSNVFSGVNTMLNSGNQFAGTFNGIGSGLTELNAANLGSGTLPSPRLSGVYAGELTLSNPSNSYAGAFAGNGSLLQGVNAATLNGLSPSVFWQLGGNPATTVGNFLGTTDNQPLELRVNNVRALRLEANAGGAPQVIAPGGVAIGTNTASGRALFVNGVASLSGTNALELGAGIPGKHLHAGKIGYQTFTPGALDIVGAGSNAISRRIKFWAEGGATFTGTGRNPAVEVANTVDEAVAISLSAPFSTWQVGQNKPPDAPGAFDSFFVYQQSAAATRLLITDSGRVGLGTNNPTHPLHLANGAYCTAGGVWTSVSDRNAKHDFQPIQPREVLAKVAALPITRWRYKAETNAVEHLGPTAQDFHSAFGLGEGDKAIGAVDADGVALAAIQGLNEALKEKETEIRALVVKNREMEERLRKLETALSKMNFANAAN